MRYLYSIFILFNSVSANAQVTAVLTVTDGDVSTTCTDNFTNPDPHYGVRVVGGDWVDFPGSLFGCFNDAPAPAWDTTINCANDLPLTLTVCVRAYENDPPLFDPCDVAPSCLVESCQTLSLDPVPVQTFTVATPGGGDSEATVELSLELTGIPDVHPQDLPCQALDLGTLDFGAQLGDAALGGYDNVCGSNFNEPDPFAEGASWTNEAGVWFTFTTGAQLGSYQQLVGRSDPLGTGDTLDLEIALYGSDADCTGNLTLLAARGSTVSEDATVELRCLLEPLTTYYVLVDGGYNSHPTGAFGLAVVDPGFVEAGDLRCEAVELGPVPTDGEVAPAQYYTNYCATDSDNPFSPAFAAQRTVWFRFAAPASGHVIIDGLSHPDQQIGVQLALYRPANSCSGFFFHEQSAYTGSDLDETMTVTCLRPGADYYLMVDGDGANTFGAFQIRVRDGGEVRPIFDQAVTVCAGAGFLVGNTSYTQSGVYSDTLAIPGGGGCDSIVNTTLTVLNPILLSAETTFPATGIGEPNGVATVSATGGSGTYSYLWTGGQSTAQITDAPGDAQYCVTVTDDAGCTADTCFVIDYVEGIIPTAFPDTVACNGDTDGTLSWLTEGGLPPYNFVWANADGSVAGSGQIGDYAETTTIPGLPAGTYSITLTDAIFDTVFTTQIVEPTPLSATVQQTIDVSCFGACDATLEVVAAGGNGGYSYSWNNAGTNAFNNDLCAGLVTVTVTDAKGCTTTADFVIDQPAELLVTVESEQDVSCFGGNDGALRAVPNFPVIDYAWSSGGNAATETDLSLGPVSVTVTDAAGCTAVASGFVDQPSAPLTVGVEPLRPVTCAGDSDGALLAVPAGPFTTLQYQWSTGATGAEAANLAAGTYTVTVSSELGCTDTMTYVLSGPAPLSASARGSTLTCPEAAAGGTVALTDVRGGVGPYRFALTDGNWQSDSLFGGLPVGSYDVLVEDVRGCATTLKADVLPPPVLTVDLGGDRTVRLGDAVRLELLASSDDLQYDWGTAAAYTCPDTLDCTTITWTPLETQLVDVFAVDTLTGCTATDAVRLFVDRTPRVYLPNAFSPDGDNQNDRFHPFGGADVEMVYDFQVYGRYGQLLYAREALLPNDPGAGWNGQFRGQPMPSGVYVWRAELAFVDGRRAVYTGDVTLLR